MGTIEPMRRSDPKPIGTRPHGELTPAAGTIDDVLGRLKSRLDETRYAACRCGLEVPIGADYSSTCWPCEVASRHADCGFYREHQGATLADFPASLASEGWALLERKNSIRGLFICGPAGTGKTRLLAAIAAANGYARFGLVRQLLRGTWNPESKDAEIRRLATAPLLLLDDVGREGRPTDDVLGTLHEILSARNGNWLPTALTSNYTPEQLAERYDPGIADRLRPWRLVVMKGPSRR